MSAAPGPVGRYRSRQSGLPSGLVGRLFGRLMPRDTATANDHAIELLDLAPAVTVLELGFGQGRTVQRLVERGCRVIGADASATMVAQATARNRAACRDGRARLARSDGTTLPFADASADAALTVHTLYFVPDLAPVLVEVHRVLRPGGRLVIAARTADDPTPTWMDPNVYRIRTAAQLVDALRSTGFVSIERRPERDPHGTNWFVATTPRAADARR
jgi:SAM-dependent methyltransferase